MRTLKVADLFCGAGGTTTGAMQAINALGYDVEFVAVNHWPVAIATHEVNHPNVRHYCKDLDTANPNEIVPEGELDLLLASPECRYHSTAQGGRPLDEQNRASAWHVVRWAERLYIRRIVVENVPRFTKWGPLDRKGRPVKNKEGELFLAWVGALEAIGYRVEWRVLNAADYGTPQTRKRLMVQARRDGRRIVWPDQTHAARGQEETLGGVLKTWEPARSAIDFDKYRHIAKPIGEKKLSPKTLARIEEGVKRFCSGPVPESFLVELRKHATARSLDDPMATVTTSGNHHVLLEPFVVPQGGGGMARSVGQPLPTVATDGAIGVVEAFIVPQDSGAPARSVYDPLPTLRTTSRGVGVVEPFLLVKMQHDEARSLDEPLPTIVASGNHQFVIEPFLVRSNRSSKCGETVLPTDEPLPTITGKNGVGLVEGFVCANRTNNSARSIDDPLPTATTATGGGIMLVEPRDDGGRLVLLHRMLQPEELGRGQDFIDYEFTGTREQQTKQIGNAVPIKLARAMTAASFYDLPKLVGMAEVAAA